MAILELKTSKNSKIKNQINSKTSASPPPKYFVLSLLSSALSTLQHSHVSKPSSMSSIQFFFDKRTRASMFTKISTASLLCIEGTIWMASLGPGKILKHGPASNMLYRTHPSSTMDSCEFTNTWVVLPSSSSIGATCVNNCPS